MSEQNKFEWPGNEFFLDIDSFCKKQYKPYVDRYLIIEQDILLKKSRGFLCDTEDVASSSAVLCEIWYNTYYAVGRTFSEEEILKFTKREINLLLKLGDTMAENLY